MSTRPRFLFGTDREEATWPPGYSAYASGPDGNPAPVKAPNGFCEALRRQDNRNRIRVEPAVLDSSFLIPAQRAEWREFCVLPTVAPVAVLGA